MTFHLWNTEAAFSLLVWLAEEINCSGEVKAAVVHEISPVSVDRKKDWLGQGVNGDGQWRVFETTFWLILHLNLYAIYVEHTKIRIEFIEFYWKCYVLHWIDHRPFGTFNNGFHRPKMRIKWICMNGYLKLQNSVVKLNRFIWPLRCIFSLDICNCLFVICELNCMQKIGKHRRIYRHTFSIEITISMLFRLHWIYSHWAAHFKLFCK